MELVLINQYGYGHLLDQLTNEINLKSKFMLMDKLTNLFEINDIINGNVKYDILYVYNSYFTYDKLSDKCYLRSLQAILPFECVVTSNIIHNLDYEIYGPCYSGNNSKIPYFTDRISAISSKLIDIMNDEVNKRLISETIDHVFVSMSKDRYSQICTALKDQFL